jgi:hypothetical protein
MTMNVFVIPLMIGALAWVLILFDWLGRRRDRLKNERRT